MSNSAHTHLREDKDNTLVSPTPPEKLEITSREFSEEILASDIFRKLPEDIQKEIDTLSEGKFSVEQIHKKLTSVIVQALANATEEQGVVSPVSLKGIKVFSEKLSKSENAKLYTSKLVSAKITPEEYLDALLGQFDKKATTEEIASITRKGVADKLSSYGQKIKVKKPIEKRTGHLGANTVINLAEGATTAGLSGVGLANILGTSQLSGGLLAGAMGLSGAAMATATIQSLGKSLEKYRNGTLKTWRDKTKAAGLPVAFALATGFAGYGIQKGDEAGTVGATAYTAAANAKMLEVVNSDQYKKLITTLNKGGTSNSQEVQTALDEFLAQEAAKGGKGPAWEAKNLLISGREGNNDTKQIDTKPTIKQGLETAGNTLSSVITIQEQKIKDENPQFYKYLKNQLGTESLSVYAQKHGYKGTINLMQVAINNYLQAEAAVLRTKQEALKDSTPKNIDKSTLSIYNFSLNLEDWEKARKDMLHPSDIGGMSYTGAIQYGSQLKTDLNTINTNIAHANQSLSEIAKANVAALETVTTASNQAYASRTALSIDANKVTAKITPPNTKSISDGINTNINIKTIKESKDLIEKNFGKESLETVEVFATNRGAIIAYGLLALGGIAGLIGTFRRERKLKGKNQSNEFKQSISNALNTVIDQIHFGINKELMPLSSVSHEFIARPVVESALWSMMVDEHSEMQAFAPAHIQSQLDNLPSASKEVKAALKNIFADIHITPEEKSKKSRLKTFGRYIGNALIGDKRNDIEKKYADAYTTIQSIDTQETLNKVLKGFAHTFDEGTPASKALEKIAAIGDTAERAIYSMTDPSLQDEMRLQNNIHSHNLYTEIENHPTRMGSALEAEYDAAKKKVFEAFTDPEKFAVLLSLEPEEIKLYTSMALSKIADHYQSEKERLATSHLPEKTQDPSQEIVLLGGSSKSKKKKSWTDRLFGRKNQKNKEQDINDVKRFEVQPFPAIETIDKRLAGDDFAMIERFLGYGNDDFRTSQEIADLIRGDGAKANEIFNQAGIKGPNRKKIFEGFKVLGEAYDRFSEAKAIQKDIQTNYASADHMTINRKTRNLKELIIKTMTLLDKGHEMNQYAEEIEAIRKAQFADNYRDLFALDTDGSSQILQQILKTGKAPEDINAEDLEQVVRSEILAAKRQKQVAAETENIAAKYSNIVSSEELKEKIAGVLNSSTDIAEATKDLRAVLDSQESLLAAIAKNDLTEFAKVPDDILSKVTPEAQEAIIQSAQTTKSNKLRQEVISQNIDTLREAFGDMVTEDDLNRIKLMFQSDQRDYDSMYAYLSNHRKLRDSITKEDLGRWVNTQDNILSPLKEEERDNILNEARAKKVRFESILTPISRAAEDLGYKLTQTDLTAIDAIEDSDERDLFIDTLRFRQALSQSKEKLIADGFSSEFANAHVSLEDEADIDKIIADALQKGAIATAKVLNISLDTQQTNKIASKNDYEKALIGAISTELVKMDSITGTSVPRISSEDLGENIEHLKSIREMAILINQINSFEGLSKIEGWSGLNKKTLENILNQRLSQERAAMMTPELTNMMEDIDKKQDSFGLNKQQLELIKNSIIANYIRAHEGIDPDAEEQMAEEYLQKKTEKATQQWKAELKSYDFIAGDTKVMLDREITTPEAIAAIRSRLDAYKKQYTKHRVAFDQKVLSLSDENFNNLMKVIESKSDICKFGTQAQISAIDLITLHDRAGSKIQVAIDRLANLADHANNLALPGDSTLLINGLLDQNERTYQSWVK